MALTTEERAAMRETITRAEIALAIADAAYNAYQSEPNDFNLSAMKAARRLCQESNAQVKEWGS